MEIGRLVIECLGDLLMYDIEGAEPDMEQVTLPPPLLDDVFHVAMDECNPEALKIISDAGVVMLHDFLTMED